MYVDVNKINIVYILTETILTSKCYEYRYCFVVLRVIECIKLNN